MRGSHHKPRGEHGEGEPQGAGALDPEPAAVPAHVTPRYASSTRRAFACA